MRFGVCASYRDVVPLAEIPFDYLEENTQRFLVPERRDDEFEAELRAARALAVPVEAANVLLPRDLKLVSSPSQAVDYPRIERYIRAVVRRAAQAGIQVIVFGSGVARACPPDLDAAEAVAQIGDHLARWGAWARECEVEIALEPLRREETNLVNTVAEGAALIARLDTPGARLLADTYHMACNGEQPEILAAVAPLLAHVHVAERRDRAAPGRYGEDLRPYFAALRRGGYDRRISIECNWQEFAAEVGPAIATLRAQWLAAGST